MFIKVREINTREPKHPESSWVTLIDTDKIEYLRVDEVDGYIHFAPNSSISVTRESIEKVIKTVYGKDL